MSKYLNDHPDDDRKTVTEDCPTCGNKVTMVWDVEQSIKDLSRIIDFVKAHSKTYDNDKERPTEINEQTIEAVRDYMLDDLKKYDAASVKYQWMKRTGETVTMEVSIEKPEQEGSHEEAAGD